MEPTYYTSPLSEDNLIDDVGGDGLSFLNRNPNLEEERISRGSDGNFVALEGNHEKGRVLEGLEDEDGNVDRVLGGNPDSGENFDEILDDIGEEIGNVEPDLEVEKFDVEKEEDVEVKSEDVEVVIFGDVEGREVGDGIEEREVGKGVAGTDQDLSPVGKGDPNVAEVHPNKLDKNDASEATEILNEASFYNDDSKITQFFADNIDAKSETVVVCGSISTELSDMVENELATDRSDSVLTEQNFPVDLQKGSKTMATFVVHNGSKSTEGILETSEGTKKFLEVSEEGLSGSLLDNDKKDGTEMAEIDSSLELLIEKTSSSTNVPTGLGTSALPPRPTQPFPTQQKMAASSNSVVASKPENPMTGEEKKLHEKVESVRVMFLRLVCRLGYSCKDPVPASILRRLARIEDRKDWYSSAMHALKKAQELERGEKDKLGFSCTILVIGKSGVGKSATINSFFDEEKTVTNPFKRETTSLRRFEEIVDGIKIQMVDTPGLSPSSLDKASNIKILRSIKKYMRKCRPDIVAYIDRLDAQTRDYTDLPVIRLITSVFGSSIWSNALIAFTHALKDPPEGPNGLPLSYKAYVNKRYHVVQQSIRQAIGDMKLKNPLLLVENYPCTTRNTVSKTVLANGPIWRTELLLLCYASKIIVEATSLNEVQGSFLKKLFGFHFWPPSVNVPVNSLLPSLIGPKYRLDYFSDDEEDEDLVDDGHATFPTILQLLPSSDCDDHMYRYRCSKQRSKFSARPVSSPVVWDHDCGFDAVSLKKNLAFTHKFSAAISAELKKDKEDFNFEMESSISAKNGEIGSTLASFNVKKIEGQQVYFLKGETKFKNLKMNKTTLGVLLAPLGDTVAAGLKLEDRITIMRGVDFYVNTSAVQTEDNMAYRSYFAARLLPVSLCLESVSSDNNHQNSGFFGSLQALIPVWRNSSATVCVQMNERKSGNLAVKIQSSDQPVLLGLIPIIVCVYKRMCGFLQE